MMLKKVILYRPIEISSKEKHFSGSTIRPLMIKTSFESLGYHVLEINGSIKKRKAIINNLIKTKQINNYLFMYVESANIPFVFSNKNHFPINPFADIANFKKVKKYIKVGFFYRDFFWCTKEFSKEVTIVKRIILKTAFFLELKPLTKSINVLFLPSINCAQYFPIRIKACEVCSLPPACNDYGHVLNKQKNEINKIRILYSGNIDKNSIYNLNALLTLISNLKSEFHLTINCNNNIYNENFEYYNEIINKYKITKKVSFTHYEYGNGEFLSSMNDVAIFYLNEDRRKIWGMPIKMYDYISLGLPIITNSYPDLSEFVEKNKIGWSIDNSNELDHLLNNLTNIDYYTKYKKKVINFSKSNMWKDRCLDILQELQKKQDT